MTHRPFFAPWLAALCLAFAAAGAWAVPSVDAVQAEVQRGNYAQAETLMREVVAAKPESAKAHYILAEVLAHNRRFDEAAQEARKAQQIDPQLRFTQPQKFRDFEQLLEREKAHTKAISSAPLNPAPAPRAVPAQPAPQAGSSGLPGWLWGVGFAVVAVLLWRMIAARRQASAGPAYGAMAPAGGYAAGPGPGYAGPGAAPGYGNGWNGAPGRGSGMLGTGLAAAGGFAAGMLAEKLLDGSHGASGTVPSAPAVDPALGGGLVPGMFDDPAGDQLVERPIDFGSGGDWDSGGGGGDLGGGGDDDGW